MKKVIYICSILIACIVIARLAVSIYDLWHTKDVLITEEKKLSQARQENSQLKAQLTQVQNPQFIEEEARNKLFLVKPGEDTVLIDPSLIKTQPKTKGQAVQLPVWQQWFDLFF